MPPHRPTGDAGSSSTAGDAVARGTPAWNDAPALPPPSTIASPTCESAAAVRSTHLSSASSYLLALRSSPRSSHAHNALHW